MRSFFQISQRISSSSSYSCSNIRYFQTSSIRKWEKYENERYYAPGEDPLKRVWHGLTYDFKRWKRRYANARNDAFKRYNPISHVKTSNVFDYELLPFRTEVLIIGGGLTGSSTAYWIKERFRDEDFKVTVVESPDRLENTRSMLSSGPITQQFAIPELIDMSLFSAEFLRHAGEHLQVLDNDPPDINILPVGFMYLARNDQEADTMKENWKTQLERGAKVAYLTKSELQERFPFMNFDDVIVGTYGLENEGLIDTWQLLSAIREKNMTLGVQYVKGTVEGFKFHNTGVRPEPHYYQEGEEADESAIDERKLWGAFVKPQMIGASARPIQSHLVVNAAGPWAGEIARKAGIGSGAGLLAVPIPIEPRKRVNFVIHAPDVPSFDIPAFTDPNGIFCRPHDAGNNFICGKIPTRAEDAKTNHSDMTVDYNEFYNDVWPSLVKRVPAFKNSKVVNAWAMYNDVNTYDDLPILGEHLKYNNFYTMAGFGNYGPQMAIAAGKLYSERIFDSAYVTINVRKYDMRRIMNQQKYQEPLKCSA
jgi:FAD-dependent oxidoreductase domain-containing protein 1